MMEERREEFAAAVRCYEKALSYIDPVELEVKHREVTEFLERARSRASEVEEENA